MRGGLGAGVGAGEGGDAETALVTAAVYLALVRARRSPRPLPARPCSRPLLCDVCARARLERECRAFGDADAARPCARPHPDMPLRSGTG